MHTDIFKMFGSFLYFWYFLFYCFCFSPIFKCVDTGQFWNILFFTFGTCWYFHFSLIVICLYFLILLNQKAIVNCKGSQKDPTQSLVFLQYSSYVLNSWVRCASGNVCFFLLLVVVFSTLGPLWFCVIIFFCHFWHYPSLFNIYERREGTIASDTNQSMVGTQFGSISDACTNSI